MNSQIKIVIATKNDFDSVISLYKQLWPKWDLFDMTNMQKIFNDDLATGQKVYFLAKKLDNVVGVCSTSIRNNLHYLKTALIEELIVDFASRNQGIGKKLLDEATDYAKSHGCFRIEVHTNINREETHKFYKDNGFELRAFTFMKVL